MPPQVAGRLRVRIVSGTWRDYREVIRTNLTAEAVQEFVRQDYLPLSEYLALERDGRLIIPHSTLRLHSGRGPSASSLPAVVSFTSGLARLIGYYLSEGCVSDENGRNRVRFSFNRDETEFINDVRTLLHEELGVRTSLSQSKIDHVTHIRVGSHLFGWLIRDVLGCGSRSTDMAIPDILMNASKVHVREMLSGLFRGDGDVYVTFGRKSFRKNGRSYVANNASAEVGYFSSSPRLFQQVIYLLQSCGFTPTFKRTKPRLQMKGRRQLLSLRDWLGSKGNRLEKYFQESIRDSAGRTFRHYGLLTTVPVKSVNICTPTEPVPVYSLEVEDNHTFATSYGIFVHNCIPLDPHYLSWKARMHGFEARFISLAEEVNSRMPEHVVELVTMGLNRNRKPVNGSKILILGVAYKRDIDDVRESPALAIIEKLRDMGGDVVYHDPYIPEIRLESESHDKLSNVELTDARVSESDCVVIVTDHQTVDYGWIAKRASLLLDTRNATRQLTDPDLAKKIIRL